MPTTLVLIHGAWAGSWVWDLVAPMLEERGFAVRRPDLPGSGTWDDHICVDLGDMVAHVIDEIADVSGPLVLVGHSGGGMVATAAAELLSHETPRRVEGLAFLAGMMLPSGMDFGQLTDLAGLQRPVGISAFTQPTPDGRGTFVPPEAAAAVFFQLAPAGATVAASRRVVPQLETARLMAPTWTPDGAGSVPRLYIEALLDRSVPIAAQRQMQLLWPGAEVTSIETDHAPQLSRPDEVAVAIAEFAGDLSTVGRSA